MAGIGAPLWFAFRGDQLLVLEDGDPVGVPQAASLEDLGLGGGFEREIGVLGGLPCFAVDLTPDAEAPEGMVFRDLRGLWEVDEDFFLMAGRARQIVEWNGRTGSAAGAGRRQSSGRNPSPRSVPGAGCSSTRA